MVPDWTLPAWVGSAGPAMALGLTVVLAIVRGWLVPGSTLDRLTSEWRERLAEAREREAQWRAIAQEATGQVAVLMGVARTTERVVSAITPGQDGGEPS